MCAYHLRGQGWRRLRSGEEANEIDGGRREPLMRSELQPLGDAEAMVEEVVVFVWENRVGWTRRPLPAGLPRHLFGRGLRAAGQAPTGAPLVSYLSLHQP